MCLQAGGIGTQQKERNETAKTKRNKTKTKRNQKSKLTGWQLRQLNKHNNLSSSSNTESRLHPEKLIPQILDLLKGGLSLSGSIPPKLEHKLRHHKQRFGKIATTVVSEKDENLLWLRLQWHRSCHSNEITLLPITYFSSSSRHWELFFQNRLRELFFFQ